MKIAVIGSGYVGLVSGACFSEFGFEVVCVDQDANKIAQLNDGKIPIYEPELDALVKNNLARRRLSFTTDLTAAMKLRNSAEATILRDLIAALDSAEAAPAKPFGETDIALKNGQATLAIFNRYGLRTFWVLSSGGA